MLIYITFKSMRHPAVIFLLVIFLIFSSVSPVLAMMLPDVQMGAQQSQSASQQGGGGGGGSGGFGGSDAFTNSPFQRELVNPKEYALGSTSFNMFSYFLLSAGVLGAGFTDPQAAQQAQAQGIPTGGAIGATTTLIASLVTNPPVSTKEYIADLGSSLGFARPAYAQTSGVGWQALTPILKIWQAFRNAAYLVFVLIFVVIGFMIMFRAKINPQTVISVQQAIPNLIITLILITFSYAIASLMIDLIYVLIYLGVGVFALSGVFGSTGGKLALDQLFGKSLMQLAFTDSGVFLGQATNNIGEIVKNILGLGGTGAVNQITTPTDLGAAGTGLAGAFFSLAGSLLSILLYVVIVFAVLFSMIKLLFQLLMAYIGIIISVIFAPFQLLFNAFPGSNGLVNWLKGLLANVLVFPATAMMFLLARIIVGVHTNLGGTAVNEWGIDAANFGLAQGQAVWQPPLLQVQTTQNGLAGLIGLGFILLTPKVVSMVKEALKVEKGAAPMSYALGAVLGVPGGVVGTPINTAMQIAQARYYIWGPQMRSEYSDRATDKGASSSEGGPRGEPPK